MTDSPIFIVGAPRSGTSITRLLLNGHSNVAVPGETSFFPAIFDRCDDWQAGWHDAVGAFMHQCERAFEVRAEASAKNSYVALKQRQHRDLRYHPVQYRPLERFRRSP